MLKFISKIFNYLFNQRIPEQNNAFDGGVFVCQFMYCLRFGLQFDFKQNDMPRIRNQMKQELSAERFLIPVRTVQEFMGDQPDNLKKMKMF